MTATNWLLAASHCFRSRSERWPWHALCCSSHSAPCTPHRQLAPRVPCASPADWRRPGVPRFQSGRSTPPVIRSCQSRVLTHHAASVGRAQGSAVPWQQQYSRQFMEIDALLLKDLDRSFSRWLRRAHAPRV